VQFAQSPTNRFRATRSGAAQYEGMGKLCLCLGRDLQEQKVNVMFGHKIPLGETDLYEPPLALDGPFTAYCDECGS